MPKSDGEALYQVPEFYEAFLGADAADLAFYQGLWAQAPGTVLDLACGTGRVSAALAAQGADVWGLDASAPMLAMARSKVSGATFVQGDLRRLDLGRRFDWVLLPYNGLQHLHSADDLDAFFSGLRQQLETGGRFALDVHLPQPALLARDPDEWFGVESSPSYQDWSIVAERSRYEPLTQVLTQTWRLLGPDASSRDLSLGLRQFYPQELQALLRAQGFRVQQAWGGFQGQLLTAESLKQVYLCRLS